MPVLLFFSLCFIILLFFLISSPSPSFSLSLSYSFSSLPLILILFLFSSYSVSIFYMIFSLKRYKKTAPSGRNGAAGKPIKSGVCGLLPTGTARRYRVTQEWRKSAMFCAWDWSKFCNCCDKLCDKLCNKTDTYL